MMCNWCSLKYCRMDCQHNKRMAVFLKEIVLRELSIVKRKLGKQPVETGRLRPSIRIEWRYEDDT